LLKKCSNINQKTPRNETLAPFAHQSEGLLRCNKQFLI